MPPVFNPEFDLYWDLMKDTIDNEIVGEPTPIDEDEMIPAPTMRAFVPDWLSSSLKACSYEEPPKKEKKPCPHDGLNIIRRFDSNEALFYIEALEKYGKNYGLRIDMACYDRWGDLIEDRFVLIDDTNNKNEHRRFWKELNIAYDRRRGCDF